MVIGFDTSKKYYILLNKNKKQATNYKCNEKTNYKDGLNVRDNFIDYYSPDYHYHGGYEGEIIIIDLFNENLSDEYVYNSVSKAEYIYDVELLDDTVVCKLNEYEYRVNKVILKNLRKISDMEEFNDPVKTSNLIDMIPWWIKHCKTKTQTLLYKIIKKTPDYFMKLSPDEQSELICSEAVKQNGMLLKYVAVKTQNICIEAVKNNPKAYEYVPNKYMNEFIIIEVLKQVRLNKIDNDLQTQLICDEAVRLNPRNILYVDNKYISKELLLNNNFDFSYSCDLCNIIPKKFLLDKNFLKSLCINNYYIIKFIPNELKTEELIKEILINNIKAFECIDKQFITEELILYIIKNCNYNCNDYSIINIINKTGVINSKILIELYNRDLLDFKNSLNDYKLIKFNLPDGLAKELIHNIKNKYDLLFILWSKYHSKDPLSDEIIELLVKPCVKYIDSLFYTIASPTNNTNYNIKNLLSLILDQDNTFYDTKNDDIINKFRELGRKIKYEKEKLFNTI